MLLLVYLLYKQTLREKEMISYLEIWEYESPIFSNDTTQIDEEHISLKEKKKRRTFEELTTAEQDERIKRISNTRKNSKWKL